MARAAALKELPPDPPGPAQKLQVLRAQAQEALAAVPKPDKAPKDPLQNPIWAPNASLKNGAQIFSSSASFVRLDNNKLPPWAIPKLPYQPEERVEDDADGALALRMPEKSRPVELPARPRLPTLQPRPPGEKREKTRKPPMRHFDRTKAAPRIPSKMPLGPLRGAFRRWEGKNTTFTRESRGLDPSFELGKGRGELKEFTRIIPGEAPRARTVIDGLKAMRDLQEERSHLMTGAGISEGRRKGADA